MITLRWTAPLAIALLAACGPGPYADEDKSDEEIRKAAEGLSAEELEVVLRKYGRAVVKEEDEAKLAELNRRAKIYAEVLARKKLGR